MTPGLSSGDRDYPLIAHEYAESVVSGSTPACKWVRLACERHLRDLARDDWQWKYVPKKAWDICFFVEQLPHIKGRWPSRNIVLEKWQCFFLCVIFGWVDGEGFRRFRNALVVIPRKNGKTLIAAAIALYLLALDQEPGAEVYSAATTRDQARICWTLAKKMVERTPAFRDKFGVEPLAHSITVEGNAAFFQPLSRDANSLEGLNPHGVIVDELHAHKTREVFDVMDEAEGARSQPLKFIISTEGDQQVGVFADQVTYLEQILLGNHEDDSYFGAIWTCDEEDDWITETAWAKANPNLYVLDARGVPTMLRSLEARVRRAKHDPASQASFKTKRLNIRAGAAAAYFNILAWESLCKDESLRMEQFAGAPCMSTIDLGSKSDLTCHIKTFRGTGRIGKLGDYYVFGSYYLPSDTLMEGHPNYDFYRGWKARGVLTITGEARTDYELIQHEVAQFQKQFKPYHVGVDPNYNALQFSQNMEKAGVNIIDLPHNPTQFSGAMKDLASYILEGRVHHNGDPILAWAIGNTVCKPNWKGDVYPVKSRPDSKIDPAVELIASISLWNRTEPARPSLYSSKATAIV